MAENSGEKGGEKSAEAQQAQQAAAEPSRKTSGDDSEAPAKSSSTIPSPGSDNGRRGRSRTRVHGSRPSEDMASRKGYHALMSSFGKVFHVEKRWKLIRELGSGAYGFVISAADDISGEPVAIKMVTRALEKVALAKRVLREITLLRHFAHENITGLIDVDCSPDLSEMHVFLLAHSRHMPSDLHQIIKSGQALTNEHVQYFVYQVLRGMKYIHSASVVHRDLKPGNLLVNADCELKICDFGLSRGFNSAPDENPTLMTEYVATRWYRAPEIMLVYKAYNTAIDVWSIGCIMAELMMGKPLFKGKDYVDQLNKILDVLGSPEDAVITRIASPKAQAYIRSLPIKKRVPFEKLIPTADAQAIDLLTKLLQFDPAARITVAEALEHPWLSAYHDVSDEPACAAPFEGWRQIEELETLPQFREAIYNEIHDYRKEVRSIYFDVDEPAADRSPSIRRPREVLSPPPIEEGESPPPLPESPTAAGSSTLSSEAAEAGKSKPVSPETSTLPLPTESSTTSTIAAPGTEGAIPRERPAEPRPQGGDPVYTYVRRSSFMQPSRTSSTYSTFRSRHSVAYPPENRSSLERAVGLGSGMPTGTGTGTSASGESTIAFPTQPQEYVVPARTRTASMFGDGAASRRLLRTLSTVSIYESGEGFAGGLADIAPIGRYIVERDEGLPSEMPHELESPPQPLALSQTQSPTSQGSGSGSGSEGSKKERARFHIQE
ncbi:kinase-like protein [Trametes versicolor FP-101664 SS1]|uniref:kinase-like protein n=1 Tax=Trametes versicolor (strain FP-101664) TaxID=717944 RepID=UPI0004624787|nr:kinase-like protein [Trametes versicolor FP-101664 SS1]EIW58623.1 kinase-like protein [Trametes versicolor FP-101664 SS1]